MKNALIAITTIALMAGCASPTSPVTAKAPSSQSSTGQIVTMVGGAAAGAAIGHEVGGDKGALIGAGAGALTAGLVSRGINKWVDNTVAEAKEEGRREAALEAQENYWDTASNNNSEPQTSDPSGKPKTISIEYPAGTYDGVAYGPRTIKTPSRK